MTHTSNLSLPYMMPSQAQKHVTHNEALARLDKLVHISVTSRTLKEPPTSPSDGDRYWIDSAAQGAWEGHHYSLAIYEGGHWTFTHPQVGWCFWISDEAVYAAWSGEGLVLINGQTNSLLEQSKFGINSAADDQNRLVVKSDAVLMSHDDVTPGDGGSQLKINKAQADKMASLLFQSNYTAYAECGLLGDNHFRIKIGNEAAELKTVQTIDTQTAYTGIGTENPRAVLHVAGEDTALLLENTLEPDERWSIAPGRSGHYAGQLIIAKGDNSIEGQHILRLPSNAAPTFTQGVAVEDGKRFSSHSSGALAYYKPFDRDRAELSFRGASESAKAELRVVAYFHDSQFNYQHIGSFTAQADGPRLGIGTNSPKTSLDIRGLIRAGHFKKANLPGASADNTGAIAYVTDDENGPGIAFSDGSHWRRMADRTLLS